MSDIADIIYPDLGKRKEGAAADSEKAPVEIGRRSDAEIAQTLYPTQEEQFQEIDEDGKPREDIIRDREGLVILRGQFYGDPTPHLQYHAGELRGAVLSGITVRKELLRANLQGSDLRGSTFHELRDSDLSGADLRGGTFKSLRGCDLRNAIIDGDTDFIGCDLTGAKYTLSEIQKAKGWRSCKGLRSNADR